MGTIAVHILNALLYSSVLFLIAGGLSLIYGVMATSTRSERS